MLRTLAIAALVALALPTLAAAETSKQDRPPPGRPAAAAPGKPLMQPHAPPPTLFRGAHPAGPGPAGPHPGPGMAGPHPGRAPQFSYHGHMVNPVHAAPFVYPSGWGSRRWAVGMALPVIFLAQTYWYADWAALGLANGCDTDRTCSWSI